MLFKELNAPSLKELFVRQMEELILSGALPIGERLPNERELAKELKVSRSIINNGMKELVDKAFVRIVPRHGAYVEDYIHNGNIATLLVIIRNRGEHLDPQTLKSLIQFRRDSETTCACMAAEQRSAKQLQALQNALSELERHLHSEQFTQCTLEFHKQIFIASGNIVYPLIYNAFYDVMEVVTKTLHRLLDHDYVLTNSRLILEAIEHGDKVTARKRMQSTWTSAQ